VTIVTSNSAVSGSDMTILNPRSRMISVRLSEEEYSALRRLCSAPAPQRIGLHSRCNARVSNGERHEDVVGIHVANSVLI